ncbi:hypothetical protein C4569_00630 [Candidatus Parcubacteria bacterium]|nr:MAG: hypothetical protein C4569_00630 [Candidatus Parcubacteria bacterium]
MKLSNLQKYILKQSYFSRSKKINRHLFLNYYKDKKKISEKDKINSITKSLDRLIEKDLIFGFGEKTAHKFYIQEIKLTPKGRLTARNLAGKQQKLPLDRQD